MRTSVIIPIYKPILSGQELEFLQNNINVLKRFDIIVVCPETLNIDFYNKLGITKYERFDDEYFISIDTYNALMVSRGFYERFNMYDYILICQTDAFVFKDELDYWAELGYDYIGAPWLISMKNRELNLELLNQVGNGGLCLRKVSKMIEAITNNEEKIKIYLSLHVPEDVIFFLLKEVLKAPYNIAAKFSFETNPREAYRLAGNDVPFGFHKPNCWGHAFFQDLRRKSRS